MKGETPMDKKILIAYFSKAGQNFSQGKIVELTVGNTKAAAEMMAEMTGGSLLEIRPVVPYPKDYRECGKQAFQELRENARPQLEGLPDSIGLYSDILLGYPNWCGTMPMAVWTFLEKYSFEGKRILPFCTHEGSGVSRSLSDLKKLCPGARLLPALAIEGHKVGESEELIREHLKKAGFVS